MLSLTVLVRSFISFSRQAYPRPGSARVPAGLAAGLAAGFLVGGEDPVEGPPGVGEDPGRLGELCRRPGPADLHRRHGHLVEDAAELDFGIVHAPGHGVPRRLQLAGVRLGVCPALVGQAERLAAAFTGLGADEALILQLLESGVDRPGARPPHAVGALADLLDDLVPVPRPLGQQRQRRRPHVTAPDPRPAREPRAERAAPRAAEPERAAPHHELRRRSPATPAVPATPP